MNIYELSRRWFDFCFENPEKINPSHTAIYFFAIEHCNRLGWKEKFGFPTMMVCDATGIKKHQTYIKYFNNLVEWGFFELIQKSSNQYSANIISLINALPKTGKALDKALVKHGAKHWAKQGQSTGQSKVPIDKQIYNITNNTNITRESDESDEQKIEFKKVLEEPSFEEKKVAQKKEIDTQLVYSADEILDRLKNKQYDTKEFICRMYETSFEEYERLCDIFVGEKTTDKNELQKEFGDVLRHFKSWVRLNHEKLKIKNSNGKQFTNHNHTNHTEERIGRNTVANIQQFIRNEQTVKDK